MPKPGHLRNPEKFQCVDIYKELSNLKTENSSYDELLRKTINDFKCQFLQNTSIFGFACKNAQKFLKVHAKSICRRRVNSSNSNKISRATQTLYRDSEAQTIPYSPEYTIPVGLNPRILHLVNLKYGNGLPVGLAELDKIEHNERRRTMEALIKTLSLKDRIRMRRAFEVEDWRQRALEIEAFQELRLQVIIQLMRIRQKNREANDNKKLQSLLIRREKEKATTINRIRSKYAGEIRRMMNTMEKKQRNPKPDKIELYSNPTLRTLTHVSQKGDKEDNYKYRSQFLETFEGLSELEELVSENTKNVQIDIKQPSNYTKDGFLKRHARWLAKLESLHKYVEAQRHSDSEPPKPLRYLFRVEQYIPRPATPSVPEIDKVQEEFNVAVLNLQRMIRGRAVQNLMHEFRQRRQLLVDELRSTHALIKDEKAEKRRQMLQVRTDQTLFDNLNHENDKTHEIIERLDATVLGDMLDLLSKELDRLIVDQRLCDFIHHAREERRMREVEESSRRQWELRRRREQEEFFKQILKVHQDTADGYFETLISQAMEYSAESRATNEIEELTKQWSADVEEAEGILTHEEEAADLVYNFLIPEVNRQFYREELKRQERMYLNAAHRELFNELESGELGTQIRGYQELRRDQSVSVNDEEIDNELMGTNAEEQVENSTK